MNIDPEGRLSLRAVKYVEADSPPRLEVGDILFNNTNSPVWVGKTTVITQDQPLTYSNHMTRLRLRPEAGFSRFFAYQLHYLQQCGYFLANCNHHVNQASISSTYLSENVEMKVPPVEEQRRIVAAIEEQFTRLDAGVAALKRVRANLKRYRAAVLKAAVEGKLTEAWRAEHPEAEPASALLERILAERRRRWEATELAKYERARKTPPKGWQSKYKEPSAPDISGLPELPNGWAWACIDQLAGVGTGATPLRGQREYYEGGTIPWVTSGAVNRSLILTAEELITEKAVAETNAKTFPAGTLLVAMYGEGKTRGTVSELGIEAATNQACAALVFSGISTICKPYIKQFLISNYYAVRRQSSGGVQPNLNLSIIKDTTVPLPPCTEQQEIVAEVERRLSVIEQVEAQVEAGLKRAARLRQSILKRAFEGKLVPQDPSDKPANALLERMRKDQLAAPNKTIN